MPSEEKSKGIISKFNAGQFQMERIHKLQERINLAWLAPLSLDPIEHVYNYQVILSCLNSLFAEVYPKLSFEEQKKGREKRTEINNFMNQNPISQKFINNNGKQTTRFYNVHWLKTQELLFDFELRVRDFLEKHKLSAPPGDRPEEAGYK